MMRYQEIITELFDQAAKLNVEEKDPEYYSCLFTIEDNTYRVKALYGKLNNIWAITFSLNGSYDASNTGNQFQVFATVKEFLQDFINQYNPDQFKFASKKSESSRIRLYDRMAQQLATTYPYSLETVNGMENKIYVFAKK